jgi:hypothetical protein
MVRTVMVRTCFKVLLRPWMDGWIEPQKSVYYIL